MKFGEFIKTERKKRKMPQQGKEKRRRPEMTQEELADVIGVNSATIHRMENEKYRPSPGTIKKVCGYFQDPVHNEAYFLKECGYIDDLNSELDGNLDISIGKLIKDKRVSEVKSMNSFANSVGVSWNLISRLENNPEYKPAPETIKQICEHLQDPVCNEEYFLKKYGYVVNLENNLDMEIGNFIKGERAKKGITLYDLANLSNISLATISRLENSSKFKPTYKTIKNICMTLPHPVYTENYFLNKYGYVVNLEDNLDMSIGKFILNKRRQSGDISLRFLEKKCGVCLALLSKMEKDANYIPLPKTIKKICEYFQDPIYNEEYFLNRYGYNSDITNKKIFEINDARQKLLNVLVNLQTEKSRLRGKTQGNSFRLDALDDDYGLYLKK